MPIYTFAPGALANLVDPRHTRTNHVLFIGWDSFRVTYTGLLPFDTMGKLATYLLMQSQYETKPIAFNWVLNIGIGPPLGFAMNCNGVQWRPTSKFGGTLYPQLNDVQRVPEPKFIAVSLRVFVYTNRSPPLRSMELSAGLLAQKAPRRSSTYSPDPLRSPPQPKRLEHRAPTRRIEPPFQLELCASCSRLPTSLVWSTNV